MAENRHKRLGYRFPAEWEPQEAVWFAWPTNRQLWGDHFERVRMQLAKLYVLAARFQAVRVLCPAEAQTQLREWMQIHGETGAIELYDYQADDVWIRDFGPLFMLSTEGTSLAVADYRYNAWGNKFPDQARDDAASGWIASQLKLRHFVFDTVLEGGAVESNGEGALLTTEAVLLNPNRNGVTGRSEMEALLCSGLGSEQVLWLKDGLEGDDTDGHIDNLARFFKADGILVASTDEKDSANYAALRENRERLRTSKSQGGTPFDLVELPLPEAVTCGGVRLAASYLNYVLLNGAVLVPTYQQPASDERALKIIAECFPDREVIGFDCSDIIQEGGALHCMSQHQPAV